MRTAQVLLFCVLAAGLLSSTSGRNEIGPDDCCFMFYPWRVKRSLVRSYYTTDQRCSKAGVILVTQKSRHICVDPNQSWVETLMKNLVEASF